ncbi:MAG: 16S rRNA (adenine(1518)-N(6)/adenine(1519)-N(6))-dimethyltransferase, partial [Phaeodactylibacter sp.]|nr:16S rRNA (adenine(1518)-N(6)/adenine(1519)-N(6))-dimethyltransferase [Phaeodactylibacter sp.]
KTYGVISVLVQAYYEGEYLFSVDESQFTPPPKVKSAVIRLTRKEQQTLECNERMFKAVVKQAFSQRRKMLRNTMKSFLKGSPLLQEPIFSERPEQLSLNDFIQLAQWVEEWQNNQK